MRNVIGDRWPEHLEKMVRFWETVLLDERTYFGSPFPPHAALPVTRNSFQTWMTLFSETISDRFIGEKAEEALWRAQKMAEMFMLKLSRYDSKPGQFIQ